MQQVKRLRHGDVFVGVMQCIDEHFWFALFERNVVRNLCGVEFTPLVALPNGKDINDLGVRQLNREDLALNLLVVLEVARPQIARPCSRRCASQHRTDYEGNQDANVAGHHLQYAPTTITRELAARRSSHAQPNTRDRRYCREQHEGRAPHRTVAIRWRQHEGWLIEVSELATSFVGA